MSAQPVVPQGHYYMYKFYVLHTNHLPTFLKRIAANSVSGNSAHHSSILLLFLNRHHDPQCPCTPTLSPPITPTTHHVGHPQPSQDDRCGNAMSPIEWSATLMQGNNDGNPSCHVTVSDMATKWWTTLRSVPPPPYCLLTPEPVAMSATWQPNSEWSSFVVWFWPNTTWQWWMDGDHDHDHDAMQRQGVDTNSYKGPPPPTKMMAHHHPALATRTQAQHHPMNTDNGPAPPHEWQTWPSTTTHETVPTNDDNGPAPPHQWQRQWPTTSTTPQMVNTAQHHPTNSDDNSPLPAPPHQWQWEWPTTSTTPPTANMAQHHPMNQCPRTMTMAQHHPTNGDNGPLPAPTDPLQMTNMAHHDPIPTTNTTHHLPLPMVRTAQHQHPHGAPHPTNGEHRPLPPTIFNDGPPPAPTNCKDGPAPHTNSDDGPSPPLTNGDDSPAQFNVVYVSMYAITCIFFKFS